MDNKEIIKSPVFNNVVSSIRDIVQESKKKVYNAVNNEMMLSYWKIGQIITEEGKKHASDREFVLQLSKLLTKEIGKGFSRSNLFNMRSFYLEYPDVQTLSGHLSWSHYCELLIITDKDKRQFYEKEIIASKWSVRELKRQIESSLFERLLLSAGEGNKKKVIQLAREGQVLRTPSDLIKDPYVLDFIDIPENKHIKEKELELRLIRHIEDFLLELGKGFMFVGSQQRITLSNEHYYVDMVFYNKILRAYVLIDLKMRKMKHTDAGQMNTYLNYYKAEINDKTDNDPIGIILCTEKNETEAKYALGGLNNQIFASKYVYHLPDKELLIQEVEKVIAKDNASE